MIIAIDPGKLTGFVRWDGRTLNWSELTYDDFMDTIEAWFTVFGDDIEHVVCENFILNASTARKDNGPLWSVRIIGVMEFLCHKYGKPLKLLIASNAKDFATNVKLRELGWYNPSPGGHQNDATRLLLTFLAETGRYNGRVVR